LVKNFLDLSLKDLADLGLPTYEVILIEVTKNKNYQGTFVYERISLRDLLNIARIQKTKSTFEKLVNTGVIARNKDEKKRFFFLGERFFIEFQEK
jgi:hypothetical protein